MEINLKKLKQRRIFSEDYRKQVVKALIKAKNKYGLPTIHHSDRGSQYCSKLYTSVLKNGGKKISMSGSAQNNAYAERVNRTIKEEYLDFWKMHSFKDLKKNLRKAVKNYNEKRIHNTIKRLTPNQFWDLSKQGLVNKTINIYDYEQVSKESKQHKGQLVT